MNDCVKYGVDDSNICVDDVCYLINEPTIGIPSSTSFCNFIFKIPVISPTTRGGKDSYIDITVRLSTIRGGF
jgi:hypothetical protein